MSKARVTWAFNDVVSSAQLNQMVTDDIVRAQLIWNSAGTCVPVAGFFNQDIGAFPYDASTQVYDRLWIGGLVEKRIAGAQVPFLQYSLDSGASWVSTFLATAWNPGIGPDPAVFVSDSSNAPEEVGPGFDIIDISGIVGVEWLRLRVGFAATAESFSWFLVGFLYSSASDPF